MKKKGKLLPLLIREFMNFVNDCDRCGEMDIGFCIYTDETEDPTKVALLLGC